MRSRGHLDLYNNREMSY